jgi:RNA polymerase sigma factor (sigma-70 family)
MNQLHPSLADIVPSVASVVYRRYRGYVEREDLIQECYLWATSRNDSLEEQLNEENPLRKVANEKRIAWQMKRHAERYARKEKANKSGYKIADEAFYDTATLAQLLPFVIKSIVLDTALEQSQVMINDGQPRKQSAPAEGGNLLASLVDIKKAFVRLPEEDKQILILRYYDNVTLQNIAEYLECAVSTADRRVNNSLRKLQNNLGGESPYQ